MNRDRARLLVVVAVVIGVAVVLRVPDLMAGLPGTPQPDEGTTATRAWAAMHGDLAPPFWDWPPLSAYVLALAAGVAEALGLATFTDAAALYPFGRWVFLVIAVATVAATALLAWRVGQKHDRTGAALAAGLLLAISFVAVRSARSVNPDHLQMLFVVGAVWLGLAADAAAGRRQWSWLLAAGGVAGLAGATKYLGAFAALTAVAVALGRSTWGRRLRGVAVVGVGGLLGFVLGTAGTGLRLADVWEGLTWQFTHQAEGHLGFEAVDNALVFHLRESWTGNWGVLLTVLLVIVVVAVLASGTREERLIAVPLIGFLLFTVTTNVRFPHYILPGLPLAAVLVATAAPRMVRETVGNRTGRPALAGWAAVGVLVLLAVPTVLHDLRLVRHAGAMDTRVLVDERLADLGFAPGEVKAESYATAGHAEVAAFTWAVDPDVDPMGCDCVVLLSNYQEDRFRRLPDRYADEVAVYDRLRRAGRVLEVVGPPEELSYRWDGLPQWGVASLPLTGPPSPTGPTVTILDLRSTRG